MAENTELIPDEKESIQFIDCLRGKPLNDEVLRELLGAGFHFVKYDEVTDIGAQLDSERMNVILLNKEQFNQFPTDATSYFRVRFLLVAEESEISSDLLDYDLILDWYKQSPGEKEIAFALLKVRSEFRMKSELSRLQKQIYIAQKNLAELNKIGASLNSEHDLDRLLDLILEKCLEITFSDAGSLYLVIEEEGTLSSLNSGGREKKLHFKISKNQSREVAFTEFRMDISSKSISGSVALTGEILNIEDVHFLPKGSTYSWNKSFDENNGYNTKSMLTVPMKNAKDEVIGVVQLINKKVNPRIKLTASEDFDKYVRTYSKSDEALAVSLAAQAAVAIDNAKLYKRITDLFEGFIRASVTAIESRDPTTSGHSERVSTLCVEMAKAINIEKSGVYSDMFFTDAQLREIKYAALLHDFGKIGVKENVLVKAKKLYPFELDTIHYRYEYIKKCIELDHSKRKNDLLLAYGNKAASEHMENLDSEMFRKLKEMDTFFNIILRANEPTVLEEGHFEKLQEIGQTGFNDKGNRIELLSPLEIQRLSIKRGSLAEDERVEIETHVTHTFRFLSKIPWTDDLRGVPAVAYAHHEKLDGSGYPRQIHGNDIPIQARIMTIADIFDALTASDRPYKKAMPAEKALTILEDEVKVKKLDPEIFKLFVGRQLYKKVM
ncbi:MAG: GAF domain-containing protein [Fibrobacteres bacterium]|nr:GAF domain-containing protein [Fibrobacterota bacterium]